MRVPPTRVKLWSVSTRRMRRLRRRAACRRSRRGTACRHAPARAGPGGPARRPPRRRTSSSSTRSGVIRAPLTMTKGASRALAPAVEQPRGDFLADAGRAGDQHAAAGAGDALQRRAHLVDRGRIAGEFVILADLSAQRVAFSRLQPLGLGRAGDQQQQPFGLERLFDEIDRAAPDRGDRGVEIAVARDDQHRDRRIATLDLVEQIEPVEPAIPAARRRAAPGSGRRVADRRQRGIAVGGGARAIALVFQHARDQFANVVFVVDDQDVECHVIRPSFGSVRGAGLLVRRHSFR